MKIVHTTAIRDAARDVAVDTSQSAGWGAAAFRHHGAANDCDRTARRMKPSADLTNEQFPDGWTGPVLHPVRMRASFRLLRYWGLGNGTRSLSDARPASEFATPRATVPGVSCVRATARPAARCWASGSVSLYFGWCLV
jgi:hypothetical protein